ncbi:hypothetical protein BDB01DRAFT_796314 [Pilobolus umbonatus]|nr:hypothetical protein BDB01DRAFT_796314 [Pilobolus umbonatus]
MILLFFLLITYTLVNAQTNGLGSIRTDTPWKAGHASAYSYPYVIIYGGSQDTTSTPTTSPLSGTTDLWAWDIRNGSWYQPNPQVQTGVQMLPQSYIKATSLPSEGQVLVVASNTTDGTTGGVLQKLDTNVWSWTYPTSNFLSSARTIGYTLTLVNNAVFTYGGVSVTNNGNPILTSVQNTLSLMDVNSFQWSSGANGLGLTDHSTCYLPKQNILITFGGTPTGNPLDVTNRVIIYDLAKLVWDVQGITIAPGTASPGARRLHTANCVNDTMIVFGGGTNQPFDSDVWVLNASAYPTFSWEKKTMNNTADAPNMRMGHSSVLDERNRRLYIYGGWGVTAMNDSSMYVMQLDTWTWQKVPVTGYPPDEIPPIVLPPSGELPMSAPKPASNVGPIVGGVVGGVLGLTLLGVLLFCIRRHKKKQEEDKDSQDYSDHYRNYEAKENPFAYSPGAGYVTTGDEESDNHLRVFTYQNNNAWPQSPRQSELGDSDKVVTGVLAEMPNDTVYAGTAVATHGSHSPRESFRNSKVLLASPTDYMAQGQVPNEIVSQKPNEFSTMINPHTTRIYPSSESEEGGLLSASMEVLRSVKTNGSSMMNHVGGSKKGVSITHATVDDEWTMHDSLSVNNHQSERMRPIQYIMGSQQLSTTTSMQTWDTSDNNRQIALNHYQYPSSTLTTPVAQPVSPTQPPAAATGNNDLLYHSVSPLDALASLAQPQDSTPLTESNSSSVQDNPSTGRLIPNDTGSNGSSINASQMTEEQRFARLDPLISVLPRHYKVDRTRTPITGRSNHILYVTHTETKQALAIKSFGRREAWERECKTLVRLKSKYIGEIVEVLTIQDEQNEDGIKYVTVMERLDETLSTYISKHRPSIQERRQIAREILKCLLWCHTKGIAFCDLKPSNIMREANGPWKLIDFEASRTIDEECVGVITPRYCPPEVAVATTYGLEGANGVVATATVDLWSLGCVIYELETKKPLFPHNMKDETILHFVSHPSRSTPILNNGLRWNGENELEIPQFEKHVPDGYARHLIKTLLSRDPMKRGSAAQLLELSYFSG